MRTLKGRKQLVRQMRCGAVVAEIGTGRGDLADLVLRQAKPAKLHLIDCWEHQHDPAQADDPANLSDDQHQQNYKHVLKRFARPLAAGCVEVHRGYSVPVLNTFDDHYFDWVYVAPAPYLEAFLSDLRVCLTKVKRNGMICGHWHRNTRAAADGGEVDEAVQQFCEEEGWQIALRTQAATSAEPPAYALHDPTAQPTQAQPWWKFWSSRRAA